MYVTESRDRRVKGAVDGNSFYMSNGRMIVYRTRTPSLIPVVGRNQVITGWRGVRPKSLILYPHDCNMYKETTTSEQGKTNIIWYNQAKTEGIWMEGDIAACTAAYYNPFISQQGSIGWKEDVDRVLVKAYAKMKSPDFAGMTWLGELKETLSLIRKPLNTFKNFHRNFKRRKRRGTTMVGEIADYVTSQWLEYRYGIMPLVYDIQAVQEAVQQLTINDALKSVRSGQKEKFPLSESFFSFSPGSGLYADCQCIEEKYRRVGVTLAVRMNKSSLDSWGLGITQIPSTMWELTTLSFVLDWLIAVGDWIQAVTPDPAYTVVASCASVMTQTTQTVNAWRVRNSYGSSPCTSRALRVKQHLVRKINPSLPVFPVPSKTVLNLKRTLDSISLGWKPLVTGINKLRRR